ncbi:MAG: protein translocase subunit SecF [Magnetococcales bacterium]|nr:protein translocase subunit SecF [Magnetococcales bacterium]
MEMLNSKSNINFIGQRKIAYVLSIIMIVGSIGTLLFQGLNFGIDFSGGTLVQVKFQTPPDIKEIRNSLSSLDLGDIVIQEFGSPEEILIRVEKQVTDAKAQNELSQKIVEALKPVAGKNKIDLRRVEFVGPQVGAELTEKGIMAVIYSMIAILVYVAWRFEMRFAYGAVLALVHDLGITIGFFSLMQKEFTLVVVAALLTVIGYSLNDTIVVYDRIREEMKRYKNKELTYVINEAVNRTLSRTMITSLTTLLVLVALLVLGGEVIHDFALTLFLGVLIGTYSSIFVASPIVLLLNKGKAKKA